MREWSNHPRRLHDELSCEGCTLFTACPSLSFEDSCVESVVGGLLFAIGSTNFAHNVPHYINFVHHVYYSV